MDELVFIARSENAGDLGYMVFPQGMLAGLMTIDCSTYIFSTGCNVNQHFLFQIRG